MMTTMGTMADEETTETLQLDVQQVYNQLALKIGTLEVENTQLKIGLETLAQRITDLTNPPDESFTNKASGYKTAEK